MRGSERQSFLDSPLLRGVALRGYDRRCRCVLSELCYIFIIAVSFCSLSLSLSLSLSSMCFVFSSSINCARRPQVTKTSRLGVVVESEVPSPRSMRIRWTRSMPSWTARTPAPSCESWMVARQRNRWGQDNHTFSPTIEVWVIPVVGVPVVIECHGS